MAAEGFRFSEAKPAFHRATLFKILKNRSYIGEIPFKKNWTKGSHVPLVDVETFQRVQQRLGGKTYQDHQLVWGSRALSCGKCGHVVTDDVKKAGRYVYNFCSACRREGPGKAVYVSGADLDKQLLVFFSRMRTHEDRVRDSMADVIKARVAEEQQSGRTRLAELQRRQTENRSAQDKLLNAHLIWRFRVGCSARARQHGEDRRVGSVLGMGELVSAGLFGSTQRDQPRSWLGHGSVMPLALPCYHAGGLVRCPQGFRFRVPALMAPLKFTASAGLSFGRRVTEPWIALPSTAPSISIAVPSLVEPVPSKVVSVLFLRRLTT